MDIGWKVSRGYKDKFGLVKSDRSSWKFFGPKFFWNRNFFGPKMHLKKEFYSVVGPTCSYNFRIFETP